MVESLIGHDHGWSVHVMNETTTTEKRKRKKKCNRGGWAGGHRSSSASLGRRELWRSFCSGGSQRRGSLARSLVFPVVHTNQQRHNENRHSRLFLFSLRLLSPDASFTDDSLPHASSPSLLYRHPTMTDSRQGRHTSTPAHDTPAPSQSLPHSPRPAAKQAAASPRFRSHASFLRR